LPDVVLKNQVTKKLFLQGNLSKVEHVPICGLVSKLMYFCSVVNEYSEENHQKPFKVTLPALYFAIKNEMSWKAINSNRW